MLYLSILNFIIEPVAGMWMANETSTYWPKVIQHM